MHNMKIVNKNTNRSRNYQRSGTSAVKSPSAEGGKKCHLVCDKGECKMNLKNTETSKCGRSLKRILTIITCCMCLIEVNAEIKTMKLSRKDETRIKRFLFPFPHELHLKGEAYRVMPEQCSLKTASSPGKIETQITTDFQDRWLKGFKKKLSATDGSFRIIAGLLETTPELAEAAKRGVFDAKYLAERKNPEQAYAITTEKNKDNVTVYIAANKEAGLYYGLVAFEQLLQGVPSAPGLIYPHTDILDWPDIRMRGSWGFLRHLGNSSAAIKKYQSKMEHFSRWKLNLVENWYLGPKIDKDGKMKVSWTFPKELIGIGKQYGQIVFPGTGHFSRHINSSVAKHFSGVTTSKRSAPQHLCYSNPNTQKFVEAYMIGIAKEFDFCEFWLSELEGPRGACQCKKCKGNTRQQYINEVNTVVEAYRKAQKINPDFRMILGLTQAVTPHIHKIIKNIPQDIVLNYYDGKITYDAIFQIYNLPPKAQALLRQGYTMGATNYPGDIRMLFPFLAPQYCRLICGEAEDRGLDFVSSEFYPSFSFHHLNSQAMAEFLWNSSGRTTKEFIVAWATRQGCMSPGKTAKVIELIEYPSRGLRNTRLRNMISQIVSYISGKDDHVKNMILSGFETRKYEESIRALELCDEAVKLAGQLKNPKLLAECRMVRYWVYILERYISCIGKKSDDKSVIKAKQEIVDAFYEFPVIWRNWFANHLVSDHVGRVTERSIISMQRQWLPLLKVKLSPGAQKLFEGYKQDTVKVDRLIPKWYFRKDENNKGMELQYNRGGKRYDDTWGRITSAEGWVKQGFNDYAGDVWYTTKWFSILPLSLRQKKHFYLLINSISGENADIYINGKKALSINTIQKDKPVSVGLRQFVPIGKKGICVSIRISAKGGTRGLSGPVTIIGCDKPTNTNALSQFTAILP
jgi:hypothetical protein